MKQFFLCSLVLLSLAACNPTPRGYADLYGSAKELKELYYLASEQDGVIDFDPNQLIKKTEVRFDKQGNCIYFREEYSKTDYKEVHSSYDKLHRLLSQTSLTQAGEQRLELRDSLISQSDSVYTYLRFSSTAPTTPDTVQISYGTHRQASYLKGRLLEELSYNAFGQPLLERKYDEQGQAVETTTHQYELKTRLASHTRLLPNSPLPFFDTRYVYMELDKYGNWTESAHYISDSLAFLVFRNISY